MKDHNDGQEPYLTNGGFASSETILWSEGDFNQRVTDLHHIFPLVGQDPDDAANYFFAASDRKLFYAARCNLDVMYRLGSAKESAGYNAHTLVPTNFANTAKVMSHIISHYTASKWADGIDYSSRISRWEIWSGPDDPDCWWAPNKTASELRTLFAEFFVTCLKQIKTDHPTVKVGGPALSKWDPDYMGAILDACDAEGVYPDFISYQCYTHDADALLAEPATIRAWLDSRGANYANCEIILSAWHYLPDAEGVGTLTQLDMDKVHEASLGEGGTMTATAAAFNLAVLSGLQNTPLARAYHGASTAFSAFSPFHWSTYNTKTPHVAANAFKLFGTVTKDYTKVLSVQNDGARSVLAVANDAGTKGALLVTDSSTAAGNVEVPLTGLSGVSGLATKVVNASNSDVQTLSSGATLTATGATIAKQAGPQAYLLTFNTVTGDEPEPTGNTYYFVGADDSGTSSFSGSTAGAVKGWATSQGGTPVQLNSLSAEDTFILTGTDAMNTLRAPGSDNPTFPGGTLMLNGGWLALPGNSQTVTVNNLVANGGGIVHFSTGATMTLAGNLAVEDGGFVIYVNAGGNSRNMVVSSKVTGAGPISFQGSTSSDSSAEYIELSGDMSEWTGTITDDPTLSSHMKQLTLKLTGSFGGTITALPAGTVAVVVNYAGLPSGKGLRVATTSIPSVLKTGLSFTGITDASAENLPLLTFPEGTVVDATQFTLKSGSTALTDLGTVENADGSITLVANKPSPPPSVIEIPTGANLTYNGQQQTGVASGVGYTLSGTFTATAVGNYTATATLDNPQETKWTDETTAAKTINWSITKATNGWKTEPSLSKTSWPVNKSPATLNVGAANFGTMTATLNDAPFDLENPVFPTVEGEYTLVITVAGSSDYGELVKEITFTITAAVASQTHYMVGKDADKTSSFVKSSTSAIGWATSQGGTVDADHEVNADDDYLVPSGTLLRTLYDNDDAAANTFKGASLTLAGELNLRAATGTGRRKITIENLIANGGTVNTKSTSNHSLELSGAFAVPEDKTLTFDLTGASDATHFRDLLITSTVTGSGTIKVGLGDTNTSGKYSVIDFAGDMSGFTGAIDRLDATQVNSFTFILSSSSFGGTIKDLPDRKNNPNFVFNWAGLPKKKGAILSGEGLPPCMRYRSIFYNFPALTTKNVAIFTFLRAKGTKAAGGTFDNTNINFDTVRYILSGTSNAKATAISQIQGNTGSMLPKDDISCVEYPDGSCTWFLNYVPPVTPTFTGTLTMTDWTEGETASEPSGLAVEPSQASFAYKYYEDVACTKALAGKPERAGTYYVRGEVAEGDDGEVFWTAAASEPVAFTIELPAEAKTRVNVPETLTLVYTGAEQVGVAEGDDYTRSGVYAATEVGEYEATVTLPNEDDYEWNDADFTTAPKTLKWSIVKAENAWTANASITKAIWKSSETPGEITPPTANFGTAGMTAQISKNGGAFEDWDGETMPTEKGKYTIRWTVADTESYSELEESISFLIDYRYEPTAPFMYTSDNGQTWKGAETIDDACKQINGSGIVEVCEDVSVSALTGNLGYKTVTLRSNVDEVEAYAITLAKAADFTIQNGGRLILTNIVFNLSLGANVSRLFSLGANNSATADLEIHAGTVISGATSSSLIAYNHSHGTVTVTGGAFKDFTCGGTILSASAEGTFVVGGLTIENCTANNLISVGGKTLNLSNVTITNNTTTAGAITVGESGKLNVSGDVIVTGNTAGGVAKNVVPTNEANIELAGAFGANAIVGVSYGAAENVPFGLVNGGDDASASRFVNDAYTTLIGKIADGKLVWVTDVLQLIIAGDENTPLTHDREKLQEFLFEYDVAGYAAGDEPTAELINAALAEVPPVEGNNGLALWKDYALGIAPTTSVKAVADAAHDTDETAITVKIPTLKDKTGSGDFTIRYQVVDRATKVEKSTTTDPSAIKIPLATGIYDIKIVFTPTT